jgi:hypothetical protein
MPPPRPFETDAMETIAEKRRAMLAFCVDAERGHCPRFQPMLQTAHMGGESDHLAIRMNISAILRIERRRIALAGEPGAIGSSPPATSLRSRRDRHASRRLEPVVRAHHQETIAIANPCRRLSKPRKGDLLLPLPRLGG